MEEIYKQQIEFQKMFDIDIHSQAFRNSMLYALIAEVVEAGNETPWKSWKRQQSFDKNKFVEELADAQLFLINLLLSADVSLDAFLDAIKTKQKINVERQKTKY